MSAVLFLLWHVKESHRNMSFFKGILHELLWNMFHVIFECPASLWPCLLLNLTKYCSSRSLATSNRMQQVGVLLAGTLDKVNKLLPFGNRANLIHYNASFGHKAFLDNKHLPVIFHSWAMTFQRPQQVWDTARCSPRWRSTTRPVLSSSSSRGSVERHVEETPWRDPR